MTTTLRFLTGVIILPQRHPLVLAKQVATLDYMSGGRFELGIGVGWLKEEFEAVGVPFEKRGPRSDEYIAVMRKLWAEDGASFNGEFVSFEEVSSNPKPVKRAVPIVIGGARNKAWAEVCEKPEQRPTAFRLRLFRRHTGKPVFRVCSEPKRLR